MTMKTWQLKTHGMQQAVLRGKFIAIQSHLKKQEKHWIDNLTLHLNQMEKEEPKTPKLAEEKNYKVLNRNKWKKQQ